VAPFGKIMIGVIGCGWLGLPLVRKLREKGHRVISTTTTPEKGEILFDITKDPIPNEINLCSTLIYTIAPLGLKEVENFFNQINKETKIIFISSTSVYGKNQGRVSEESNFEPNSKNALVLRAAESFLKKNFTKLSIIRPGGLYGEKRHPIYFLTGKKGITTGDEYLHLVSRDDCLNALSKIIEDNLFGEDFNLVSDLRILKRDYYTQMAKKLNLAAPEFLEAASFNDSTQICNDKSKIMLSLSYENPLDYN